MNRRGTLNRNRIVEAAMAMLDEGRERQFSMRKLAARLGVDPMALYHHHASRQALMKEVMADLMEACEVPDPGPDWRCNVRALCRSIRRLARRHPGTFRAYVVFEDWVPAEHRLHEAFYAALLAGGFSERATVSAVRLLLAYAETFAVDEMTGWIEPLDETEHRALLADLTDGEFPSIARLAPVIANPEADAEFEFGLDVLIGGLERYVQPAVTG